MWNRSPSDRSRSLATVCWRIGDPNLSSSVHWRTNTSRRRILIFSLIGGREQRRKRRGKVAIFKAVEYCFRCRECPVDIGDTNNDTSHNYAHRSRIRYLFLDLRRNISLSAAASVLSSDVVCSGCRRRFCYRRCTHRGDRFRRRNLHIEKMSDGDSVISDKQLTPKTDGRNIFVISIFWCFKRAGISNIIIT